MGKKGKKKKKGGLAPAGIPFDDKSREYHVYLSMQAETLEREYQVKSAEAEDALRSEMELRVKVEQMEEDFSSEQATTFAVTADMARQYKALQEELIYKINSLETQLTEQKEELDMTNHELSELTRDKDDDIFHKDQVISQLNERMNEMSQEFAGMLAETLDLLRKHIDEKFTDDKNEGADNSRPDFAKRLQEYSQKAYDAVSASTRAIGGADGQSG